MTARAVALAILFAAASSAAAAQTIMKREPPTGALKRGTVILVDDGSCPRGQIKEVTAGAGQGSTPRSRRCVPKR